jgi:hypothetical protein
MAEKAQTSFVITANRLSDGTVLYLDPGSRWVEALDAAWVTADATERDRLLAFAKTCELEICGPYAMELVLTADGSRQMSARERLRALGPADVRRRLGY